MSVLDELGAFAGALAAPAAVPTALTLGTNLFLSRLPADPDQCVSINETPGTGGDYDLASAGAVIEHPRLQVLCRDLDYAAARAMAKALVAAFDGPVNTSIAGTRYLGIDILQPPFHLDDDDRDRVLIAFNISCWKAPS